MKRSSKFKVLSSKSKKEAAFLWDESFLWGLMACKALRSSGLPFDLIRSEDIRYGCLEDYRLLFVPGGWASNKLKALGSDGAGRIRDFVSKGGNYIGFCGGAGLATLDGIGLLDIKRKPTKERVPSFSGRISIDINDHPIWDMLAITQEKNSKFNIHNLKFMDHESRIFYAWWPSQFLVESEDVGILARFNEAMPDAFSSDLNISDIEDTCNWSELEDIYQINLDPGRLKGEPAVVEGLYGDGKVILSLLHLDTPGDTNGSHVLKNLWRYLLGLESKEYGCTVTGEVKESSISPDSQTLMPEIKMAMDNVSGLISLGLRNFLWFWRMPMMLQWRRGVRGLEYCTLYAMIKEIYGILCEGRYPAGDFTDASLLRDHISRINETLPAFVKKAERLLILERCALQNSHINYERCNDPEISELRRDIFSTSKSHGGMFKRLIDEIDSLLYRLLATVLYIAPSP